jgi:hypothetical protein
MASICARITASGVGGELALGRQRPLQPFEPAIDGVDQGQDLARHEAVWQAYARAVRTDRLGDRRHVLDRTQLGADRQQRHSEQQADTGDQQPADPDEELVGERIEQEARGGLVLRDDHDAAALAGSQGEFDGKGAAPVRQRRRRAARVPRHRRRLVRVQHLLCGVRRRQRQGRRGPVAGRDHAARRVADREEIAARDLRGRRREAQRIAGRLDAGDQQPRQPLQRLAAQRQGVAIDLALDEGQHQRQPDPGHGQHSRRDHAEQAVRRLPHVSGSRIT